MAQWFDTGFVCLSPSETGLMMIKWSKMQQLVSPTLPIWTSQSWFFCEGTVAGGPCITHLKIPSKAFHLIGIAMALNSQYSWNRGKNSSAASYALKNISILLYMALVSHKTVSSHGVLLSASSPWELIACFLVHLGKSTYQMANCKCKWWSESNVNSLQKLLWLACQWYVENLYSQ